MNITRKIITLLICLSAFVAVGAQNKLHIETLFDDYGKQEGSILIELGKDVLGNHTQITRYKSLIISADQQTEKIIREAIQKDIVDGEIFIESTKNGKEQLAYYSLKKEKKTAPYEYILFTTKNAKTTLIYVTGNFAPNQLQHELEKLRSLFIKVNNERVKLL
jgi:hypothetical protein